MSDALTTQAIDRLSEARVCVVGDVMLDRFVYGEVERISPEAPIPVLRVGRTASMLGGAGNVARNLVALGAKAQLCSVLGDDEVASQIEALCSDAGNLVLHAARESDRRTTLKTRYIAASQQMLRADEEDARAITPASEAALLAQCESALEAGGVLVLSDYAKGVLTPALTRRLVALARERNARVLVDPKQWDISLYEGAFLLSPNEKEMTLLHGGLPFADEAAMQAQAASWCAAHAIDYILITRGAKGMVLVDASGVRQRVRAVARDVFDVSGAGDTAIATLAAALGSGMKVEAAVTLANHAAGIAVGRLGTATVHRTDLKAVVHTASITSGSAKILSREAAREQVARWQERGLRVGFTNGCFDIVHAGHVASISTCRSHCDRLVLALNSDDSVRRLKGAGRPVNVEMNRALLLAALSDVDAVVIFREDTPEALLHELRPNVLMKGEDYQKEQIVGWDFVESYGGQVVRIPLVPGESTTGIIERLVASV